MVVVFAVAVVEGENTVGVEEEDLRRGFEGFNVDELKFEVVLVETGGGGVVEEEEEEERE